MTTLAAPNAKRKAAARKPRKPAPAVRRTQTQRREATVAKLLDAAAEALIDVGYTGASVQEICTRAGVSQGALFRHFSSRMELMIRVSEHVGDGLIALYQADFQRLRSTRHDDLALALQLLRSNVQSRLHQAWFELLLAARTDLRLQQALRPIWQHRDEIVQALARSLLPEAARTLPQFDVIVDTMVTLFHGEAVDRFIRSDAAAERRRMDWLLQQLREMLQRED